MKVHTLEDGSIRFAGEVVQVDLDARQREASVTTPVRGTFIVPFSNVHQVGLVGRPGGFLALHLHLKGGRLLELGHVVDPKVGYQVASRVAKLIDCAFGGIVRMATSFVGEQFEGPTAWMDLITSVDPPATPTDKHAASTQEVAVDDIMGAWPKDTLDEDDTDATVMEAVVPDGAKTVEVPSLVRNKSGLMDDFDSACVALLEAHTSRRP